MKPIAAIAAASTLALLSGCAPGLVPAVRGRARAIPPVRLAFFLPVDARSAPPDRELSDDAPLVVREAVARELSRSGCPLAPSDSLDEMVRGGVASGDLSWGEAARLAQRVGADLSLVGRVSEYRRGSIVGPSTVVAVRVDVVTPDGRTAWTVEHRETAGQEDPAILARDVGFKVARALVSAWGGCGAP